MIGYTNPGWVNGAPPAINATNLNAVSNAVATMGAAVDNGAAGTATKIYNDQNVGAGWGTLLVAALSATSVANTLVYRDASANSFSNKFIAAAGNSILGGIPTTYTTAAIAGNGTFLIPAGCYYYRIQCVAITKDDFTAFEILDGGNWRLIDSAQSYLITLTPGYETEISGGIILNCDGSSYRFRSGANGGAYALFKWA